MSITILQLHKRSSYEFKFIQDKYAIEPANKAIALADGTTQSFNSETWAEIITSLFVLNPTFDRKEIIALFNSSVEQFNNTKFEFSSNPAMASLEKAKQKKGGTATFIGLNFSPNDQVELISCGDTNFFILNEDKHMESFPYSDVDSLDRNNYFINTTLLLEGKVTESFFQQKSFSVKNGDKIILATDALSRLILNKSGIIEQLLQLACFEDFLSFCNKYWESKELQEDDISAIIINNDNNNSITTIVPPIEFSFPKEKENDFVPTSLLIEPEIKYTDMEMQEIRNQFNGVANDFRQVKKKQKLHEVLLILAICLLAANIFLIYSTRSNKKVSSPAQPKVNKERSSIENRRTQIDALNNHFKFIETLVINQTTRING